MNGKRDNVKRRSFLKMGLAGAIGLGAIPGKGGSDSGAAAPRPAGLGKMPSRILGKTGIRLPLVSMGVMNADNPALVAAALDAGIVMLDTAWGYQRGRNEQMIGKVLDGRPRDSFIIATKVPGMPRDRDTGYLTPESDPGRFHEMFDQSLKRLGLEYVDILYLHNVKRDRDTRFEPLMEAMLKEKKRGRVRFIGLSTHQKEPEVIRGAIRAGIYDVVLTAYNFRKDDIDDLNAAVAEAAGAGLGIVAMKTQAGVYWDKEKTDPINMKAALKWALNNPDIHTAIPGFTTFDQMKLDLSVMEDLTLTEEELRDLRLGDGTGGLYCQGCESCLPQCPEALPVPDLMRGYMYAFGYRNLEAAHQVVSELRLDENPCGSCFACSVRCAKNFDVRDRITDITRLRNLPADFFV